MSSSTRPWVHQILDECVDLSTRALQILGDPAAVDRTPARDRLEDSERDVTLILAVPGPQLVEGRPAYIRDASDLRHRDARSQRVLEQPRDPVELRVCLVQGNTSSRPSGLQLAQVERANEGLPLLAADVEVA